MNTELIARLEAAEVGSRELDWAVYEAVNIWRTDGIYKAVAPWTRSLDAAIALAERVLPGWFVGIQHNRGVENASQWSSYIDAAGCDEICGDAHTPALALCIAILRALDAQETAPL